MSGPARRISAAAVASIGVEARTFSEGKNAMLKLVLSAIAIMIVSLLVPVGAGAFPRNAVESRPAVEHGLTKVRDGCGPGSYYSRREGECVERDDDEDDDGGYARPAYGGGRSCRQECSERRAECNWRRGGYFNGCGVAYSTCMAACN